MDDKVNFVIVTNSTPRIITLIDEGDIYLSKSNELLIENARVIIESGQIKISGKRRVYEFFYSNNYFSHPLDKDIVKYKKRSIYWGYKNLKDRILGKKTPYLSGWCELVERENFNMTSTNYDLIDKRIEKECQKQVIDAKTT